MLFTDLLFLFLDLSERVRGLNNFLGECIVGLSKFLLMLLEKLVFCFRLLHPFEK
jgi:hypothetical protein